MNAPDHLLLDEAGARRLLLVQAFDASPADNPLWTPEDRTWASRLARETTPKDAQPGDFLRERARHALQRLLPRDLAASRALDRRLWRARWLAMAVVGALLIGLGVDAIGSSQHINLLAPPIWAVIVWNLFVYLAIPLGWRGTAGRRRGLRTWFARRLAGRTVGARRGGVLAAFHAAWLRLALRLMLSRAALLLHAAAAALAVGLVAGLYLRGIVLDYRVGWQSTFLDAEQVRLALAVLLRPASALTGIAVPDVTAMQALQISADHAPSGPAAPWIHLYAAMLAVFVVVPRALLAALSGWRSRRLSKRLRLPLNDAYFQRLLRQWHGEAARVQVLPFGAAPAWSALAGLKELLATALGPGLQMEAAEAVAYGDEERAATLAAPAGTSLRVLLVDLAATPEDEAQGRFAAGLRSVAPALPLLLVADESAWRARFADLPERLAERRAAWQRWADAQGLGLVCATLEHPDLERAEAAVERALQASDAQAGPRDSTGATA